MVAQHSSGMPTQHFPHLYQLYIASVLATLSEGSPGRGEGGLADRRSRETREAEHLLPRRQSAGTRTCNCYPWLWRNKSQFVNAFKIFIHTRAVTLERTFHCYKYRFQQLDSCNNRTMNRGPRRKVYIPTFEPPVNALLLRKFHPVRLFTLSRDHAHKP